MEKLKIPERLLSLDVDNINTRISYYLTKKKKKKSPSDPKSIYGIVLKELTNQESTREEREYIHGIWRESHKENVEQAPLSRLEKVFRKRFYYKKSKDAQKKRPRSKESEKHEDDKRAKKIARFEAEVQLAADKRMYKQAKAADKLVYKQAKEANKSNKQKMLLAEAQLKLHKESKKPHCNVFQGLTNALRTLTKKTLPENVADVDLDIHGISENNVNRTIGDINKFTEGTINNEIVINDNNTEIHPNVLCEENRVENTNNSGEGSIANIIQNEETTKLIEMISKYMSDIQQYPIYECPVCKRLVYKTKVSTGKYQFTAATIKRFENLQFYEFKEGDCLLVCTRCQGLLKKNKIPPMYHLNNMDITSAPDVLQALNEVELRLISQVKLFMKVFHLCKGRGQLALKGSCIHFPQSVDEVIETLPLNPETSDMVVIHEHTEENLAGTKYNVRGNLLYGALQYLKTHNHLYHNVEIQQIDEHNLQISKIQQHCDRNLEAHDNIRSHILSQPSVGFLQISDSRYILRGNIHQASPNAFPDGGNQCTAICTVAIAHAQICNINTWTSQDLDNILFCGDRHYRKIIHDRHGYLLPEESDGLIKCFDAIDVKCTSLISDNDVIKGCLNKVPGSHLKRLPAALLELTDTHKYAILTVGNSSMAIIILEDSMYLIDSHSRGPKGRVANDGKACILRYSLDTAATEFSSLIHYNYQPSDAFNANLPLESHMKYMFTITPVIAEMINENNNNIDGNFRNETENQQVSNPMPQLPVQVLRNPNQIMLDCIIMQDEPTEPSVQAFLNACKTNQDVIPPVHLQRLRGRPLYPEKEKRLEELAFVKAFPDGRNGYEEARKIQITPLDYFQQRVMSANKVFHNNDYLFYALCRTETHAIHQKISVCGNMATSANVNVQDNEVRLPGLENVHLYMQSIRGSGSYWKKYTAEVLSMIETIGVPTFFLTISYDDLNSVDALTALWKAKYGPNEELISDPKDMPYETRKDLLNCYPVAAARHFSHKMNVILSLIRNEGEFLFGRKIVDYTYRVEFQGRGSPHVHALLWVENPPPYNSPEGVEFIEKNISCSLEVEYKDLVMKYQNHRHTNTCFKRHNICRFGFPRKPSAITKVLDEEETAKNHGRFLDLKRSASEICINNYHPKLLQILKCNMDINLVTGCRAIAFYVGKYMSKGEPTIMREEVRTIIKTFATNTRSSYFERAKKIASSIINKREISSQECAFRLCHLLLRRNSRQSVFVPSYFPESRIRLVRSDTILSDEPMVGMNIIDRYVKRPIELEQLCLFEFAAWWKPRPKSSEYTDETVETEEKHVERFTEKKTLLDNKGEIQKREHFAVVRYPRFNQLDNFDEYIYSMMLLYKPFRNEEEILRNISSVQEAFEAHRQSFRTHTDDPIINSELSAQINAVMVQLQNMEDAANLNEDDGVCDDNFQIFEELGAGIQDEELFANVDPSIEEQPLINRVEGLTPEQKRVYNMVREKLIQGNRTPPLLEFIQGGAGVGKSHLIRCISELVATIHPAKERAIIRAAPTGVAACNITGVTIHRAFSLGVEQHGPAKYIKLGGRTLDERRKLFKDVVLIIIDEISMISYNVLRMIHLRLMEIFGNDEPFGNISILLFGDLLQLQPVRGTWCFQQPNYLTHEVNLWKLFNFNELTTVMRQRQKDEFYDVLQKLRIGTMTHKEVEILTRRALNPINPNYQNLLSSSDKSLHLYPKIRQVDEYNTARLKQIGELGIKIYKIFSDDRYGCGMKYGQKVPPEILYTDIRKCAGIPTILEISIGTKVMLKWNIHPLGGLANGSIGVVRGFKWTALRRNQLNEGDQPECVYVQFEGTIDEQHLSKNQDFNSCVEIKLKCFQFPGKRGVIVMRNQIPLVPSFSASIHKSQGLSLDSCTVYLGKHLFRPGLAYVAVSRVRSYAGLFVTDIDEKKLIVNKKR